MSSRRNEIANEIEALISEIRGLVEQAGTADLSATTLILRMARLDLLALVNDIDASELKAFSESLDNSLNTWAQPPDTTPQSGKGASRKPLNH